MGSKTTQNALFPYFSELLLVFFAKTSLRTVQTFAMGHSLKFPAKIFFLLGGAPRGSRNSPNYHKIAFLSRFPPICWDPN